MTPDWDRLQAIAESEVQATLQSLPPALRARAGLLPIVWERIPNPGLIADGIEPDTLGLFVGPAFHDEGTTPYPLPPQVILFLQNLWAAAEADEQTFREEIRTTLLHELGHYLGLDEDDLFERGLE